MLAFFQRLWEYSLFLSARILFLRIAERIFGHRVSGKWRYVCWTAIVLELRLPLKVEWFNLPLPKYQSGQNSAIVLVTYEPYRPAANSNTQTDFSSVEDTGNQPQAGAFNQPAREWQIIKKEAAFGDGKKVCQTLGKCVGRRPVGAYHRAFACIGKLCTGKPPVPAAVDLTPTNELVIYIPSTIVGDLSIRGIPILIVSSKPIEYIIRR